MSGEYVLTLDGKVAEIRSTYTYYSVTLTSLQYLVGLNEVDKIESAERGVFIYKRDQTVWHYLPGYDSPDLKHRLVKLDALNGASRTLLRGSSYIGLMEGGQVVGLEGGALSNLGERSDIKEIACTRAGCVFMDSNAVAHFYGYEINVETRSNLTNEERGVLLPRTLAGITNARQVSAASDHFSILYKDGTVAEVNLGDPYQLDSNNEMVLRAPRKIIGLESINSIATTDDGGIALRDDGAVWKWLHTPKDSQAMPSAATLVGGLPKITAIAVPQTFQFDSESSDAHVLALDESGHVWAFGRNFFGQLGDGTLDDRDVPVQVVGISDVVAIATIGSCSLAITQNGDVWRWGRATWNSERFCGDALSTVPVPVVGLSNVAGIMGWNYNFKLLFVNQFGQVWSWNGTEISAPVLAVPVATGENKLFYANRLFSVALDADGTFWTWGYPFISGHGLDVDREPAPLLPSLGMVTNVSATHGYVVATNTNGKIWAWGAKWPFDTPAPTPPPETLASLFSQEAMQMRVGGSGE